MIHSSSEVNTSEQGLLEIKLKPDLYFSRNQINLSSGSIRYAINQLGLEPEKQYTFLSSIANPEANNAFNNEEVQKRLNDERNTLWRDWHFSFNKRLHDTYLETLSKIAGRNHTHYPLVDANNGGDWPHVDSAYWPEIHIIKGSKKVVNRIQKLIENLNSDRVYKTLAKSEAPNNYLIPQINFLREREISPLILENRSLEMSGKELTTIINFLCQMQYTNENFAPIIDCD